MDYKKLAQEQSGELTALRRAFHARPELGYQEFETAKTVAAYLRVLGLQPKTLTKTGLVATIRGAKPGPTILLRADMDALPQQEATGLGFASQNPGVMHACGHDGHMAVLLVTAKILTGLKEHMAGNVKLVFQPNEEEAGALAMIEAGVLEDPKVDMAFSQHVWSLLPVGSMGVAPGAVMAALEHFEITVHGRGGHTSSPHLAIDPIPAACQMVSMAQHVQTRALDPLSSVALLFGEIKGGTAPNVIADAVQLTGTLRYLLKDEKTEKPAMKKSFEAILNGVAEAYGVRYDLRYIPSNPSMHNDENMVELARKAAEQTVGGENISAYYCMGGEDFAEFSHRVPSCFFFTGAGNPQKGACHPHHHPKFNIDEDCLPLATEMFLRLVGGQLLGQAV